MTIDGRSLMKSCPSFSKTSWKDLLEWNYILWLKLFMQFALSILELKTSKKEKNIWTANRRQREKGRLRVEQRLLKKRLKEMPNEHEFGKKQLSKVKEKVLVIARAENQHSAGVS